MRHLDLLTVNMFFTVAANLTNVSRDHTVREGSDIQLFCEAAGRPTPNITWSRVLEDGSNSEVLHNRSTWDFPNINRTASGTYRCTADNGIGNPVRHKVKVNVTCKYMCAFSLIENPGHSVYYIRNPFLKFSQPTAFSRPLYSPDPGARLLSCHGRCS